MVMLLMQGVLPPMNTKSASASVSIGNRRYMSKVMFTVGSTISTIYLSNFMLKRCTVTHNTLIITSFLSREHDKDTVNQLMGRCRSHVCLTGPLIHHLCV